MRSGETSNLLEQGRRMNVGEATGSHLFYFKFLPKKPRFLACLVTLMLKTIETG